MRPSVSSWPRLCENPNAISQILILMIFDQQNYSESNHKRVFRLVLRSKFNEREFSHSLGRLGTDSRLDTGQSAWINEGHRHGSHVDPEATVAVVCFATLEIAAKPHGHGWHADARDYFDIRWPEVSTCPRRLEGSTAASPWAS